MEKVSFVNSLQQRLYGYFHQGNSGSGFGPTVILCHGMMSAKEGTKQTALAQVLEEIGISVLRFDFSFCGESEGVFEEITFTQEVDDLRSAVNWVKKNGGRDIGLFGSSMGGGVAVLYAKTDPSIKALVTLAAVAHPIRLAERMEELEERMLQWKEEGNQFGAEGEVGERFFQDLDHHNIPAAIKEVTAPVLIIHGQADEVVDVQEAYDLYENASEPKVLKILPEADHRITRPEDLSDVLQTTTAFFRKYL